MTKVFITFFIVFCSLFSLQNIGHALIGGYEDFKYSGVLRIDFKDNLACTATLVGLNPPTMVTAAHCLVGSGALTGDPISIEGIVPLKMFYPNELITSPEQQAEIDNSLDIAVLTFPDVLKEKLSLTEKDLFTVAPVSVRTLDEIETCGFGRTSMFWARGNKPGYRKCGTMTLYNEELRPNDFDPSLNDLIHEMIETRVVNLGENNHIWTYLSSVFRNKNSAIAISSNGNAMGNGGDSGGPWFLNRDGNKHLIAVSSYCFWTHTQDSPKGLEKIIAHGGYKLTNLSSIQVIQKAILEGADVLGAQALLPLKLQKGDPK